MLGRSERREKAVPRAAGGGAAARGAWLARGEVGREGVGAFRDMRVVVVRQLGEWRRRVVRVTLRTMGRGCPCVQNRVTDRVGVSQQWL